MMKPAQGAISATTKQKTAFAVKIELALAQTYPPGLAEMLREAGRLAALNGAPPDSALIDIVSLKWKGWIKPSATWCFQRAYWQHHTGIDPEEFFDIKARPSTVTIRSKGVAGAHGEISLHAKHVPDFFRVVTSGEVEKYERWATDPHPVGGKTVLLRMDAYWDDYAERSGHVPPEEKGMLCIDPDTHPSTGKLFLGEPEQELQQLGALIQLQGRVQDMLETAKPNSEQLVEAAKRAKTIIGKAGICFMPATGLCSCCKQDVTLALVDIGEGSSITGCPLCGYSWCE